MTPDEFTAKLEELRTLITEKITELEEGTKWGSVDEREPIIVALDELVVQAEALSASLSEIEDEEDVGEV